jgi:hypothetical protein
MIRKNEVTARGMFAIVILSEAKDLMDHGCVFLVGGACREFMPPSLAI